MSIKTDPNKFYTVIGAHGGIPFGLEPIFDTVDTAAAAIAREVNKKLKEHGINRRVNIKSCYDGRSLVIEPNLFWDYKIIAHDKSTHKKKERVAVICYGLGKTYTNAEDAIKFYTEAVHGCDPSSSECSRYNYILDQLRSGAKIIDADLGC